MPTSPKQFFVWPGVADRLIGEIVAGSEVAGSVMMRRLDGSEVGPVAKNLLRPATDQQVGWAIWLGGTTIPMTGVPPQGV